MKMCSVLKDLITDLKSELSGDYKELVMALFVSPAEFDAWCIKEAIYVCKHLLLTINQLN